MFKRIREKRIREECWNVDRAFMEWFNEHIKVYKRDASKAIDLEFHKFEYKGKEYTMLEMLDREIELSDRFLEIQNDDMYAEELIEMKDEILDIFKEIYFALWW